MIARARNKQISRQLDRQTKRNITKAPKMTSLKTHLFNIAFN